VWAKLDIFAKFNYPSKFRKPKFQARQGSCEVTLAAGLSSLDPFLTLGNWALE
jgi:hypothetical protein